MASRIIRLSQQALIDSLSKKELVQLIGQRQARMREKSAENEAPRASAFARWHEPVPRATDEERCNGSCGVPGGRGPPAGPLPPFELIGVGTGNMDAPKLLGHHDDDGQGGADQG